MTINYTIKAMVPEFIKTFFYNIKNKRSNLFMDRDFIEYVCKKKKGLEKHGSEIELLALRGSHCDYGIYSNAYKSIFNLGLTSSDLYTSHQLYEKSKALTPNLKYVVLFYSVFTPGLCLIKTKEKNRLVTYNHIFKMDYQTEGLIDKKEERKILKKIKKIQLKECSLEDSYRGYVNPSHFGVNIKAETRIKTHLRENKREPNQLEHLLKLSKSVNNDNRKLVIILSPNRADYKSLLKNNDELFSSLYQLQLKNVDVIDYYNCDLFLDSDFGDTDHLNEKGAKKLTENLLMKLGVN